MIHRCLVTSIAVALAFTEWHFVNATPQPQQREVVSAEAGYDSNEEKTTGPFYHIVKDADNDIFAFVADTNELLNDGTNSNVTILACTFLDERPQHIDCKNEQYHLHLQVYKNERGIIDYTDANGKVQVVQERTILKFDSAGNTKSFIAEVTNAKSVPFITTVSLLFLVVIVYFMYCSCCCFQRGYDEEKQRMARKLGGDHMTDADHSNQFSDIDLTNSDMFDDFGKGDHKDYRIEEVP